MTSQRWLTDADFSEGSEGGSVWWHYLVVIVPDNLKYTNNGTMWITGCGMNFVPDRSDEDVVLSAALATNLGMVTGVLFQIPNEHLTFSSDPIQKSRGEDAIIAFTWDHFLKDPSDPTWLLRFPMVKASLRAMDTITDFMKTKFPEKNTQLDYYTVAGASKRGWTTWDVGAVDPKRVMAIVPVVLDAINFVDVEHHQYRSYGAWSYALSDYTDLNLTERFDSPNMIHLQENVDPYFYKDRLTMPKLVCNAAMDEFQQPGTFVVVVVNFIFFFKL
jgi:PhoPQ-activated pathogenicity-related protein